MSYTWSPSVADVAALVPNRAQDASRTFTDTTYPNVTAVEAIIASVCSEVAAYAGDPDSLTVEVSDPHTLNALETLSGAAKRCAAFGAAAQIELAFSAQGPKDGEKQPALMTTYNDSLTRLRKAVAEFNTGQSVGGANDIIVPIGNFPKPQTWLVPPGMIEDPETHTFKVDSYWGLS